MLSNFSSEYLFFLIPLPYNTARYIPIPKEVKSMRLFNYLILAHLIGDYLIQTEFEALNKALGRFWNRALISHCVKYTLSFLPLVIWFGLPLWWLLVIYGSHMVLDRRWFIIAWRKYVTRNSAESIKATFWLTVVIDQIFHVFVLAGLAITLSV